MMTYDEACRILAPWIQAGKNSVKTDPMYGPGPRLWGCPERKVYITYLPNAAPMYHKFHRPQFQANTPSDITDELRKAAKVFAARQIGPAAFM